MTINIAKRLNKGRKIDWEDYSQSIYYLQLSIGPLHECLELKNAHHTSINSTVYCLDRNFKDVAIEEIGEKRLIKYLKGA